MKASIRSTAKFRDYRKKKKKKKKKTDNENCNKILTWTNPCESAMIVISWAR